MICIYEIKTFEVHGNEHWIEPRMDMAMYVPCAQDIAEELTITREMIQGQKFVNVHGDDVCIGMSKKVREAIGLPFEVLENMKKDAERHRHMISSLKTDLREYQDAGFWKRLKYAFTRDII